MPGGTNSSSLVFGQALTKVEQCEGGAIRRSFDAVTHGSGNVRRGIRLTFVASKAVSEQFPRGTKRTESVLFESGLIGTVRPGIDLLPHTSLSPRGTPGHGSGRAGIRSKSRVS